MTTRLPKFLFAMLCFGVLLYTFLGGVAFTVAQEQSSQIAFLSKQDDNNEIYIMNADGSNQVRLTSIPYLGSISWSPDGKHIVFSTKRDDSDPENCFNCNYEIYMMNTDGTNLTRLTNNPADDNSPVWSPDGKFIAFTSTRTDMEGVDDSDVVRVYQNTEIYIMNVDGSNQTRLTNDPTRDLAPTWSPDGKQIAFMSDRDQTETIGLVLSQVHFDGMIDG